MIARRGFVISCDTCDAKTHEINTDNQVVALRVAIDFHHWKTYPDETDWKIACPRCVYKLRLIKDSKRKVSP